jgi:hypothetical protein
MCVAFGLQGADYDIYPSFSNVEDDGSSSDSSSMNMRQMLSGVGAVVGIGGGAYVGYRLAKKAYINIKKGSRKAVAASLTDGIDEFHSMKVNVTMVEEMRKEQEELWRFVHSLFKSQEDMTAKLEKKMNELSSETIVKEVEESFTAKISDLSRRLELLEARLECVEELKTSEKPALDEDIIQNMIRQETKELSNAMIILKKETKNQMLNYLKDYDDAVVQKIKFFGEDIKKLMKKNDQNESISKNKNIKSKLQHTAPIKPKPK